LTALSTIAVLASVSAALSAPMAIAWLVWYRTRNSGWVDTIWTISVGSTGCIGALWPLSIDWTSRQIAVAAFITVWAFRLAAHLAYRTSWITDDPRYASLVESWGKDAPLRMFSLLQKQALVSIPLALAVVAAAWSSAPGLRAQDVLGLCILIVAIAGEALADHQLRDFSRDPNNRGTICDRGLWAWSRHPNYFCQ
jgi:steroid 5-alpha reductase family enzyme